MSDPNTIIILALQVLKYDPSLVYNSSAKENFFQPGKGLQLTCLTLVRDLSCELPDSAVLPPSLMVFFRDSRLCFLN